MLVDIDSDELHKGTVDESGRKYIGREYAGKDVTVAVVEVHDDD